MQVAWLTTWPRDQVGWLIRGPLSDKLVGPWVPWQNWSRIGAPGDTELRLTAKTEIPSLVVRRDKFVGVALADVERVGRFFDEYLEP